MRHGITARCGNYKQTNKSPETAGFSALISAQLQKHKGFEDGAPRMWV